MSESLQIIVCVRASRPAAELIDPIVAQARLGRAVVIAKTAHSATFVRLNAPDASLVMLACQALRGRGAPPLRFGIATASKPPASAGAPDAADPAGVNNEDVDRAQELAASAREGQVLVSPELALLLAEAGFSVRARQVLLSGGRSITACTLDLEALPDGWSDTGNSPGVTFDDTLRGDTGFDKLDRGDTVFDGSASGDTVAAELDAGTRVPRAGGAQSERASRSTQRRRSAHRMKTRSAESLGEVFKALLAQAKEMTRAQEDLEARRAEMERQKRLGDALVAQLDRAHQGLDALVTLQRSLLPMAAQVTTLQQTLVTSEQRIAAFEGRLVQVEQGLQAALRDAELLAEREALVQAVKADVEKIHEIGAVNRADLQFLADQRSSVAGLHAKIDHLRGSIEDNQAKVAAIDSRRKTVDEVHAQASAVTHMLTDISVNLEMLSERRAEIDLAGDKLARLDFTLQEAQNTLRALQRERELAERVEQGIKALRARGGVGQAS